MEIRRPSGRREQNDWLKMRRLTDRQGWISQRRNPQERAESPCEITLQPASPNLKEEVTFDKVKGRLVINLSRYHQHPSQQVRLDVMNSRNHVLRRYCGTSQVKQDCVKILRPHRGQRLAPVSHYFTVTAQIFNQDFEDFPGRGLTLD